MKLFHYIPQFVPTVRVIVFFSLLLLFYSPHVVMRWWCGNTLDFHQHLTYSYTYKLVKQQNCAGDGETEDGKERKRKHKYKNIDNSIDRMIPYNLFFVMPRIFFGRMLQYASQFSKPFSSFPPSEIDKLRFELEYIFAGSFSALRHSLQSRNSCYFV